MNLKLMTEDLRIKESIANERRQKLLEQNECLQLKLEEQKRREEERDRQADERRFHDFRGKSQISSQLYNMIMAFLSNLPTCSPNYLIEVRISNIPRKT